MGYDTNHWQQRKPMWAIENEAGMLMGSNGVPTLYDRRADAREAFARLKSVYALVGIVKVRVKYDRI